MPCSMGLVHNLDTEDEWHVAYNVFPLQMTETDLAPIRQKLANHQLHAFLIHLSEGGREGCIRDTRVRDAEGPRIAGSGGFADPWGRTATCPITWRWLLITST